VRALVVFALLAAATAVAEAYPQYQLASDVTCPGCHLSPAGGGLLTENGLAVAESSAWRGNDPKFLHGALELPGWLELGGDARLAAGMVDNGKASGAAYPMQAELHASAGARGFSLTVDGGVRRPNEDTGIASAFWSREHYVMWQQAPGETEGLFVRAGRFAPVYGLRFAEHVAYTQRYGGSPLYAEAYGASVEYVARAFEVHATGFVHDPIATAWEKGDGGALYAEVRLSEHAALGAEGKYASASDQQVAYGGITGKLYLPGPDVLLQGEGELVRRSITGDKATSVIGYLLATRKFSYGVMADIAVGHYQADTRVAGLYRDAIDVNVHWFETSHLEWLLTTRLELLDHGAGTNGGYALIQVHYRL